MNRVFAPVAVLPGFYDDRNRDVSSKRIDTNTVIKTAILSGDYNNETVSYQLTQQTNYIQINSPYPIAAGWRQGITFDETYQVFLTDNQQFFIGTELVLQRKGDTLYISPMIEKSPIYVYEHNLQGAY